MTTTEFSIEFDKLYDNLSTMGAPGIDAYEKSLFLTYAQEYIVKELVTGTPRISMLNQSFEIDESTRRSLSDIVYPYQSTDVVKLTTLNSTLMLNPTKSYLIKIPTSTYDNMWWVMQEQGYISLTNSCGEKWCDIVPKMHDEYTQIQNPFRVPDTFLIWRFDVNSKQFQSTQIDMSLSKGFELISEYVITKYKCRYVKKPTPIVVENLTNTNTDLYAFYPITTNLSIDGVTAVTECTLNSKVHRLILNKAVDLAVAAYKENNLQNKLLLNQGLT